jgi:predicted small lipoprotein YifL
MKRSIRFLIAMAALSLLVVSCATKPPAKAPEPAQPAQPAQAAQPSQPAISQAELDGLLGQAQALKKRAFDLKLYEVLPDDYKAADAAYADGKASYDAKDSPAAKDKLTTAIGLFQDLNQKGVIELASNKKKDAEDMRAAAVKVGADTTSADRFAPGDSAMAAAAAAADAKDWDATIATYERARALFELAYRRTSAAALRERIDQSGYAAWDQGNWQTAEAKYADDARLFDTIGGPEAAASPETDPAPLAACADDLEEAALRYNLVIQKGRQGIAMGKKEKTDEVKARSDGIKASVAVKDDYSAALSVYQEAISAFAAGDFETAAAKFDEAGADFQNVYALAADKRAKAEAAMQAAAAAADSSLKKAQDADQTVGASEGASTSAGDQSGATH